jgi:hypothetical protein
VKKKDEEKIDGWLILKKSHVICSRLNSTFMFLSVYTSYNKASALTALLWCLAYITQSSVLHVQMLHSHSHWRRGGKMNFAHKCAQVDLLQNQARLSQVTMSIIGCFNHCALSSFCVGSVKAKATMVTDPEWIIQFIHNQLLNRECRLVVYYCKKGKTITSYYYGLCGFETACASK